MVNVSGSLATTATAMLAAGLMSVGAGFGMAAAAAAAGSGPSGDLIWSQNGNLSSTNTTTVRPFITTVFDTALEGEDEVQALPFCSTLNISTSLGGGGGWKHGTTTTGGSDTLRESSTSTNEVEINGNSETDVATTILGSTGSLIGDFNESELIYGTDTEAMAIMMADHQQQLYQQHHHHQYQRDLVRHRRSAKRNNELTIEDVKYFTYGILWPTICGLGIIGNILNLIVLNQPNMKGTAYIYMRGYSSAALMAITVAIPFANRVLHNNEVGPWTNIYQAFFHTYLELYLGNSCLGIGVMMLVALTMERFVAVCHPEQSRALQGSKKAYIIIASIPICTFLTYSPHLFLSTLLQCVTEQGVIMYQKRPNFRFLASVSYWIYKWFLGLVFRLIPTVLLAYLNLRIIIAYRRTCARRRIMTGKTSRDENKKFAEESRIMLLLGSTSVLFFVCVTPMVILSVMISDKLLKSFSFQVFRATANLLEVTNYSLTFYIYCLFSREFRNTFLGLLKIGQKKAPLVPGANGATPTNKPSGGGTGGTNGKISSDPAVPVVGGDGARTPQLQGGSTPLL